MMRFYVKERFKCPHCSSYYVEEELVNVWLSLYGGEPTMKCEYCYGRIDVIVHDDHTVDIRI